MQRQLALALALALLAATGLAAPGGARAESPIIVDYGISGHILDDSGQPVEGVSVDGTPFPLLSDAAGSYSLFATLGASYTLTPRKAGYRFEPPAQAVTVVAGTTEVDFVAIRLATFLPLVGAEAAR